MDRIGAAGAPSPNTPPNAAGKPSLEQAAQDFEALLLNTMIKAMRASVPRSDLFGETKHIETYEQLLDTEYAKAMAEQGGFGFARMLVDQLGSSGDGLRSLQDAASRLQAAERGYSAHTTAAETMVLPGGER